MRIELASSYGFCFGVKRAIKIAENAKDAVTIGPIIHNNDEINRLNKNFNVKTLEGIDEINGAKKAIIRTHGITKGDLAELKKSDIKVIDATCPFEIPAVFYLLLWFVTQVFSGLSDGGGAGVAWWAHIGGFVAGMLLLRFFRDEPRP